MKVGLLLRRGEACSRGKWRWWIVWRVMGREEVRVWRVKRKQGKKVGCVFDPSQRNKRFM